MFLLDTNVVSELRKAAIGKANPQVVHWCGKAEASDLYLSAITIQELELGVLRLERRDTAQGLVLRRWLANQVLPAFEGRILALDTAVALQCARLHVPDPRPVRDSLIGATAFVHRVTLVTRNTGDFEGMGIPVLDPWLA